MGGSKRSEPPPLSQEQPAPSPRALQLPEMASAAERVRKKNRRKGRDANILAGRLMNQSRGREQLGILNGR